MLKRYDLPGGARRLVMPAQGVHSTIVNGVVLYEDGRHTGALPGQVVRSGERQERRRAGALRYLHIEGGNHTICRKQRPYRSI